ncbi:unnamed protein product [Adineta ricciae]|uniref:Uncharacterized protein n=1 Tax=Adineta ricciae TaxID=249248 RepID=A0A814JC82_ADIRI|nr:unnamed protein product [Adineta ricciae]CAF1584178.1 unnamed protein product [Adineta ricciae]
MLDKNKCYLQFLKVQSYFSENNHDYSSRMKPNESANRNSCLVVLYNSHYSKNRNHPSINTSKESSTDIRQSTPTGLNRQISDINHRTQPNIPSPNIEHVYRIIDQSYSNIPVIYNSIKQTKLDSDFIVSVNDYLDRLKANIYKNLIRRGTLLRNGTNHIDNLLYLLRCVCKIAYEQSVKLSQDSTIVQHAVLYTMTAIDYILQHQCPQKKPLFNYILNEYISMWLHENFRVIQEDFCIIAEYGNRQNFSTLCACLFHKFKSVCAGNWERLQMMQNYRLTHFDQLMKTPSDKLESNHDFIQFYGKPIKPHAKRSEIPITPLYSNQTDNELINLDEIHEKFRKSVANILMIENQGRQQSITNSTAKIESSASMKLAHQHKTILPLIEPIVLAHQISTKDDLEGYQRSSSSSKSQLLSIEQQHQLFSLDEAMSNHNVLSTSLVQEVNESMTIPLTRAVASSMSSLISMASLKSELPHKNLENNQEMRSSVRSEGAKDVSIHSVLDSNTVLNVEVDELIRFLKGLANSSASLSNQLKSCLEQSQIDSRSIINKISHTSSVDTQDPLFLAEFIRNVRKELQDARIQINDTAAGDNIDQERIFIQIIHDPSRCMPDSKLSPYQNPRCNHHSIETECMHESERKSGPCHSQSSSNKNYVITSDSLFYARKSSDRNTHSIIVEHNDNFVDKYC